MKKLPVIWMWSRMRSRVPALIGLVLMQAVHALLCVLFALGSRGVIDEATSGDQQAFLRACLMQAGVIGGIVLFSVLMRHLRDKLQADLDRDFKKHFLGQLLSGEYAAVSAYHSAELLNRMNQDVARVCDGVLTLLPNATAMVVRLAAAIAVMGVLDMRFTLLIAAVGLLVIAATAAMRKRLKTLNRRVSEQDGRVSACVQEALENLLLIKAMDVSGEVEKRAEGLLDVRYDMQRKRKNVSLAAHAAVQVMAHGVGFAALCWCGYHVLLGSMTFGSLTAIIQLVGQLRAPFVGLSGVLPQYTAMLASAERLMELDELGGDDLPATQDAKQLYAHMQSIAAQDVTFAYDRDRVLKKVSFALEKGCFAVITGPSGEGKSTLLKLMMGIFSPEAGRMVLKMEGQQEQELDRSARRLFAYVPQGNMLFSGTVRENLLLAKPDATQAELEEALRVGAVDAFLAELPMGLETMLGQGGAGLSEGQLQRLAIARAVLSGAPILLLDECTSALDEGTEQQVLTALRGLHGRTCIAITHRPAALEMCDVQLHVAEGSVCVKRIK